MKLVKNLVLLLALCVTCGVLFACNTTNTTTTKALYLLPDLTGKTVFNYSDTIDINKVYITIKNENHATIPANEFIRYGNDLIAGSAVEVGSFVEVYFSLGPEKVTDTEKPQIIGVADIEIPWNSTFDPLDGVSVVDNVDGDLMNRLKYVIKDEQGNVVSKVETNRIRNYFVTYTVTDKSNNTTEVVRKVSIKPNEIDLRYTNSLTLDTERHGNKTYLEGGISRVTLSTYSGCVDGDTARFNELDGSVRFLGVDTPESTPAGSGNQPQQWGKAASKYTCDRLKGATEIIIEAEGTIKDTYGRYLAFIWVDGKLLNLELVEQAFSQAELSSSSRYFGIFMQAELYTRYTLRRIWGETDPECPTCDTKVN